MKRWGNEDGKMTEGLKNDGYDGETGGTGKQEERNEHTEKNVNSGGVTCL